jgi:hypothetical protein
MKKIILFLAVLLAVGCSKKENGDDYIVHTLEYNLLKGFDLLDRFHNIDNITIGTLNDTIIYFSGRLKGAQEIGLIVFNDKTKTKLADIIPLKENTITIDKPYGEKEVVEIRGCRVGIFLENETILLLVSIAHDVEYAKYWCFIKNGELIKIDTFLPKSISSSKPKARKWRNNFLIQLNNATEDPYLNHEEVILCSPFGEKIIDVTCFYLSKLFESEIIGDFESISVGFGRTIRYDYCAIIERLDLRKEYPVWRGEIDLSKLDRPRIDGKTLIEKTDAHFTYEINYTEYSGSKGVIKFKVNIETGNVEYL